MNVKLLFNALSYEEIKELKNLLIKDEKISMGVQEFVTTYQGRLSIRAISALRKCNENFTVRNMTKRNLRMLRNVGWKTAKEITELLTELGINTID